MNLKEVLKILIYGFQKDNIDFVLAGGLALSTMGIFRILQTKFNEIDIELVREYFKLFNKEALLNEWLSEIEQWGKI